MPNNVVLTIFCVKVVVGQVSASDLIASGTLEALKHNLDVQGVLNLAMYAADDGVKF
jgi:hypothetical protein